MRYKYRCYRCEYHFSAKNAQFIIKFTPREDADWDIIERGWDWGYELGRCPHCGYKMKGKQLKRWLKEYFKEGAE